MNTYSRSFFEENPHQVAQGLLGATLYRDGETPRAGRIVEVEVYGHSVDPASHGDSNQPTARTRPMFGAPGTLYVYQIYGMYCCCNVVTSRGERPAAILIRALEPISGLAAMALHRGLDPERLDRESHRKKLLSGPGKICQAMEIGREHNGLDATRSTLRLIPGEKVASRWIAATPRIGLNPKTCGESAFWPWRYVDRRSGFLSRRL